MQCAAYHVSSHSTEFCKLHYFQKTIQGVAFYSSRLTSHYTSFTSLHLHRPLSPAMWKLAVKYTVPVLWLQHTHHSELAPPGHHSTNCQLVHCYCLLPCLSPVLQKTSLSEIQAVETCSYILIHGFQKLCKPIVNSWLTWMIRTSILRISQYTPNCFRCKQKPWSCLQDVCIISEKPVF